MESSILEFTLKLTRATYASAVVRLALALSALVISACAGTVTSDTDPSGTTATTVAPTGPTSTVPPVVDCPGAGEFEEGTGIARIDGAGSDSTRLGRISWRVSDQCESFSFEFETAEGAPATTVPELRVAHLESFQVIRVEMSLSQSIVADQLVETDLVKRLYVVRALDGSTFVDLHLARPAAARARVAASPARLTVDLRPGFVDFAGTSALDDQVVVVSPPSGADVDRLTSFTGYARPAFSPVAIVVTQGGAVVAETETVLADPAAGWAEFRHQIALPSGELLVLVGGQDPDGAIVDGVTVDLTAG